MSSPYKRKGEFDFEQLSKKIIVPNVYNKTPPKPSAQSRIQTDDDDFFDMAELPSDTLAAIQSMRSQYENTNEKLVLPNVVLKTQLYTIVHNRTEIDKELENLKRSNKIRIFKLLSGNEDYAILITSDYIKLIRYFRDVVVQQQTKDDKENAINRSSDDFSIFETFIEKLLPNYSDVSISRDKLESLLSSPNKKLTDKDITYLVNAGVLVLRDVNVWWLSIPNIGSFTKSLIMGRREIASLLKRKKWKECLLNDLERKKLRYSTLGINYHVKDLIGKGIVDSVDTTSGKLIRLVNDKEAST